jgi:hypothetical protein
VCGKTPTVAGLQDLLIYSLKGLGSWAHVAMEVGCVAPCLSLVGVVGLALHCRVAGGEVEVAGGGGGGGLSLQGHKRECAGRSHPSNQAYDVLSMCVKLVLGAFRSPWL